MKQARPMTLVFVFLTGILLLSKSWFEKKGFDHDVLMIGNMVLFLVSLVSFLVTYKSLSIKNPHAFVRAIYTGFIVKFFLVVIAAFVYIKVADAINKPALFACMGFYVIYAFLEVRILLQILKQKKNA
ncbi:MAG TPA: hypothetical protein PK951_07575 [Chitinophagaceae bacterium]|nr:hypothetical protein [Chitinophagaceae bacterium]HUM65236.1 hypothetical protein [Chitinophagaceae bacterium]